MEIVVPIDHNCLLEPALLEQPGNGLGDRGRLLRRCQHLGATLLGNLAQPLSAHLLHSLILLFLGLGGVGEASLGNRPVEHICNNLAHGPGDAFLNLRASGGELSQEGRVLVVHGSLGHFQIQTRLQVIAQATVGAP